MTPTSYKIIYTRGAADQLEAIFEFIEQDSPASARRMISRILYAIDGLQILPHRYPPARNIRATETVRSMVVRPYLVRYVVDDRRLAVTILSLRHGARSPGL